MAPFLFTVVIIILIILVFIDHGITGIITLDLGTKDLLIIKAIM